MSNTKFSEQETAEQLEEFLNGSEHGPDKLKEELSELFESSKGIIYDFELVDLIDEYKKYHKYPLLYRYCPVDYNNIRMLETKSIYLAPIGKLNDAFEGVSFAIKEDEYLGKKFDKLAYVKCFSEKKDNLAMWGLYSDAFTGMCVEYDVNKFIGTANENLLYHIFPIVYNDRRTASDSLKHTIYEYRYYSKQIDSEDGLQDDYPFLFDIMYMFLNKNKAWEFEQEWRFVVTSPQLKMSCNDFDDNDLDKIQLSSIDDQIVFFDCINAIYIGPRMKKHIREHIQEIGKKLNVSVIEMKLSETEYKLIPKQ